MPLEIRFINVSVFFFPSLNNIHFLSMAKLSHHLLIWWEAAKKATEQFIYVLPINSTKQLNPKQ